MEYHEMMLYASKSVIFSVKEFVENPVRENFLKAILSMRQDLTSKKNDLALQLRFRFEMGAACFGLVSSSPE